MREQTDRQTGRSNLRLTRKSAFTLVELLVVIVVIGILFAVLISRVDFASDDAKATGAMTDLRSFQTAAHAIALKHNGFDSDLETLANQLNTKLDAELQLSVSGNKLVSAAADPWGTPYEVKAQGSIMTIASAGKNTSFKNTDDMLSMIKCVTSVDGFDVVVSNHTDLTGLNFTPLESASWADISEVSASGLAPYVYSIGDTKVVNSSWTVQIADFDHDDLADGSGKVGITFTTLTSTTSHVINNSGYNYGGWKDTEMRTYLNSGAFYTGLSTDLKSVIKSVSKVSDDGHDESTGNQPDTLVTTSDKLWLLSCEEVGLYRDYSYVRDDILSGQGSVYELYKGNVSRLVNSYEDDDTSCGYSGSSYWLRSACRYDWDSFFYVDYDGSDRCTPASYEYFVAPGFCI